MRDARYQRVRAPIVDASDLYFRVYSGNTGWVTVPLDLRTQLEQVVLEGFTAVDHGFTEPTARRFRHHQRGAASRLLLRLRQVSTVIDVNAPTSRPKVADLPSEVS
jgi:hypothetical protein